MIKIQALRRAFYNGEIIRAGQILTITSNKVPAWAKRIGKETPDEDAGKTQKKDEGKAPVGEQQQLNINPDEQKEDEETETPDEDAGKDENPDKSETAKENIIPEEFADKSEKEILEILDDLITKGIEVGVMIEDAEKKTPVEQIIELRKLIEAKKQ